MTECVVQGFLPGGSSTGNEKITVSETRPLPGPPIALVTLALKRVTLAYKLLLSVRCTNREHRIHWMLSKCIQAAPDVLLCHKLCRNRIKKGKGYQPPQSPRLNLEKLASIDHRAISKAISASWANREGVLLETNVSHPFIHPSKAVFTFSCFLTCCRAAATFHTLGAKYHTSVASLSRHIALKTVL